MVFRRISWINTRMHEIFIEVRGGVVQEVYSDAEGLQITLLDWDFGDRPGDAWTGGVISCQSTEVMPKETAAAFAAMALSN